MKKTLVFEILSWCIACFFMVRYFDSNTEVFCKQKGGVDQRAGILLMLAGCLLSCGLVFAQGLGEEEEISLLRQTVLLSIVFPAADIDYHFHKIPNSLIALGGVQWLLLFAAEAVWGEGMLQNDFFSEAPAAAAVFFGMLLINAYSRGSLGMGDVKLLLLMELFLGLEQLLSAVFLAGAASVLLSFYLLFFHGKGWNTPIPFGPLLMVGTLLLVIFR